MRPSNKSRSRNKSSGGNQRRSMGNVINRVFESAGPDGKVRGTPQQVIDKYQALARDAQVSGDRVAAESYLQHAEHYSRLLGDAQRQQQEARQSHERDDQQPRGDHQQPQQESRWSDSQGGENESGSRADDARGSHSERGERAPSEASGLTTIDMQDSDDHAGPVDTPESRRSGVNGAEAHSAPGAERGTSEQPDQAPGETRAPAKRSRPRKKAKVDAGQDTTAAAE